MSGYPETLSGSGSTAEKSCKIRYQRTFKVVVHMICYISIWALFDRNQMEPSRVVNLRLDKFGRAGQAKIFKWIEPGRSGPKF